MPIALTPIWEFDHVLVCDRELPREKQTIWKLRALSSTERSQYDDARARRMEYTDGSHQLVHGQGTGDLALLRFGLLGVEGHWVDANGKQCKLEFEKTEKEVFTRKCKPVTYESLDLIAPEHRTELAKAIRDKNTLEDADRKN